MAEDPYKFSPNEELYPGSGYEIMEPKSRGGSAIVYKAQFKGMVRAIKILAPKHLDPLTHPKELDASEWEAFAKNFRDEVKFLIQVSHLSHPNIARILDHGVCIQGKANGRPYYVMEFIEGDPFVDAVKRFNPPATDTLRLIDELLDALVFLHTQQEKPIMHMDVKSENVLVRSIGTRLQAVLVDVGVAKVIPSINETKETTYRTTKINTRPDRQHLVHTTVGADFIRTLYPDEDLYQFGGLLADVFALPQVTRKVLAELDEAGRLALQFFINRLRGPQAQQYTSVIEVRDFFRKLFPAYAAPMGIPELAISGDTVKQIALPTGRLTLSRRMTDIVDSALFQRLHRLKQLNFVYLILPGANHTRFLHSLHAYSICRDFIWALLEDARFRLAVSSHDLEAILLYALLHDIGHYPLSHMFEDFHANQERQTADPSILTDEEILKCLLFPDTLSGNAAKLGLALQSLFRQRRIPEMSQFLTSFDSATQARLKDLVLGGDTKDRIGKVLRGLIDGPIDVDKAAYLCMDSTMTGMDYGKGIDLEGLLGGLRYPSEFDIDAASSAILAITDKGLSAAESLILARYWMIKRVYWHHTNRAVMAMVKFVVESLLDIGVLDFEKYLTTVFFDTDLGALHFLCSLWDQYKDRVDAHYGVGTANPTAGILSGQRYIYKRLLTISRQGPSPQSEAYMKIDARSGEQRQTLCEAMAAAVAQFLPENSLPAGYLLLDVPEKDRESSKTRLLLYRQQSTFHQQAGLGGKEERGQAIFDASPIVHALASEFDQFTKKCRVFIDPTVYQQLKDTNRLHDARQSAEKILYSALGVN